jgi:hypothetical protein
VGEQAVEPDGDAEAGDDVEHRGQGDVGERQAPAPRERRRCGHRGRRQGREKVDQELGGAIPPPGGDRGGCGHNSAGGRQRACCAGRVLDRGGGGLTQRAAFCGGIRNVRSIRRSGDAAWAKAEIVFFWLDGKALRYVQRGMSAAVARRRSPADSVGLRVPIIHGGGGGFGHHVAVQQRCGDTADDRGERVQPQRGEGARHDRWAQRPVGVDRAAGDAAADQHRRDQREPDGRRGQSGRNPGVGSYCHDYEHQQEGDQRLHDERPDVADPGRRNGGTQVRSATGRITDVAQVAPAPVTAPSSWNPRYAGT